MDQIASPTANGSRITNQIYFPRCDGSRISYEIYSSPEIYELEQERIFRRPTWTFVALEAELPNSGKVMKGSRGTILWLVFLLIMLLFVNALNAGSVLKPTIIHPSRPLAACETQCPT
jgi:hypothetical protein